MKKHLGWAIRMLIAAAGVAYILYTLNWTSQVVLPDGTHLPVAAVQEQWVTLEPGLDPGDLGGLALAEDGRVSRPSLEMGEPGSATLKPSIGVVIDESRKLMLLSGLAVFTPIFFICALRWMMLMRARGIAVSYARAFRLTMAGHFFSICMPGTTGGDVMKAIYATRMTDQRGDAVISVAVDRVCGLVGQIVLAGTLGLFLLEDPLIRRITIALWVGLVALICLAYIYASPKLRQAHGIGRLLVKLPGSGKLRQLDERVAAYRDHKGVLFVGVLMSIAVHLLIANAMAMAGLAVGIEQDRLYLLATAPIVLLLWALPISGPLGLGPLDYVGVQLIVGSSQTTAQQAVVMFVVVRLYAVTLGLAGSLALFGSNAPSVKASGSEDAADEP